MKIGAHILCTILLSALPVITANNAVSQVKIASALIKQDTTEAASSEYDTLIIKSDMIEPAPQRQAKSGTLAMIFSAIVPGTGQIYAHRYYTIPLIWGFGAYFYSQWTKADDTYRNYRSRYSESVQLDTTQHTGNSRLIDLRNEWRNYRDGFAFYIAITYLLNIIDAYVGAVLYDFDVSDNLGGSAEIRLRIPLH